MPFKPVDTALKIIVGPAIDDGDFKSREETIAFNQAGMEVDVILEKYDGTIVTTAVTPTAAGDYDWAHTDQGYYSLELPAIGGASFNNTEEGIITVVVYCTGVLPFRSVSYDIIESQAYDALVKGTDALQVDAVEISGDATAANNAELAFDGTGYGFTNCTMPTVTTLTNAPGLLQRTTIATLASQTSFTLTAGSADDDAYNTAIIVITDSVTAEQKAVGWVDDYTGATKTITLTTDPGIFTMAVGDIVDIIATDYLMANIWATVSSTFTQVGIDGAGLTNMPWNGTWDAEVQSEVNDALVAFFTSAAELVDNIWDEVLTGATHNIATSAGRRVREIGAYAIHSGTALAGNSVHITLAATASATDGVYNRNLMVLTGGTGAGQTRTIVDYDGATKIALVDREWRTNPDATTEYQITPDDTPLVVDHGVAQPGSTATTIKIRSYASAVDDTYLCNIVSIIAGTGRGQARLVGSYNGTTKVITICGDNWATTPDGTSVYVMVPYGAACVGCINTDALTQIKTECDTALSDVHLDDLIQLALTVNDAGPNATDFITSSAVAVDNWYNENMLLFTSGALAGLARVIEDYDGATKRIYLTETFPQAPANGNQFVIVGIAGSTTTPATVADAVWDELEAGHTIAGSFGEEVTRQGKKLDRNFIWELTQQSK